MILVTGSAGHLGEALMRTLAAQGRPARGVDLEASPWTHETGSIADRATVRRWLRDADVVVHTATLHKPHVATHPRGDSPRSTTTPSNSPTRTRRSTSC